MGKLMEFLFPPTPRERGGGSSAPLRPCTQGGPSSAWDPPLILTLPLKIMGLHHFSQMMYPSTKLFLSLLITGGVHDRRAPMRLMGSLRLGGLYHPLMTIGLTIFSIQGSRSLGHFLFLGRLLGRYHTYPGSLPPDPSPSGHSGGGGGSRVVLGFPFGWGISRVVGGRNWVT